MARNGSSVERQAERAARKVSPWVERLAGFGYLAYGVVYRYRRIEPAWRPR